MSQHAAGTDQRQVINHTCVNLTSHVQCRNADKFCIHHGEVIVHLFWRHDTLGTSSNAFSPEPACYSGSSWAHLEHCSARPQTGSSHSTSQRFARKHLQHKKGETQASKSPIERSRHQPKRLRCFTAAGMGPGGTLGQAERMPRRWVGFFFSKMSNSCTILKYKINKRNTPLCSQKVFFSRQTVDLKQHCHVSKHLQ